MCRQGCIRCNYRCARKAYDRILAHFCHHMCKSVIERLACASTLNLLASIITCVFRTRMNFISRVKKCIVTRSLYCSVFHVRPRRFIYTHALLQLFYTAVIHPLTLPSLSWIGLKSIYHMQSPTPSLREEVFPWYAEDMPKTW